MTPATGKKKTSNSKNAEVRAVLDSLKKLASDNVRNDMSRYGIFTDKAFGIRMNQMQQLAKELGKNHELALALWETGWYEARTVAALIDVPSEVTSEQMDSWCRDFDNWGICDTVCFKLFDQNPNALSKIKQWAGKREEFVKRAAFALLASVALHDKTLTNEQLLKFLPLVEKAAIDERNFVKKGVSWALRVIGRKNSELNAACIELAERLSQSESAPARWIGRDAVRELKGPTVTRLLKRRATKKTKK